MNRRLVLLAALLTAASAALLLPAGASAKHSSSVATITRQNQECAAAVKPYDYASQACSTITLPKYGFPGQPFTEKFVFTAKARLTNVVICFSPPNYRIRKPACKHPRKFMYSVMNKGDRVSMTVTTKVPEDIKPGTSWKTENYTTSKPAGSTFATAYWETQRAFAIIRVAPQSAN